jgi:hypothetical protein
MKTPYLISRNSYANMTALPPPNFVSCNEPALWPPLIPKPSGTPLADTSALASTSSDLLADSKSLPGGLYAIISMSFGFKNKKGLQAIANEIKDSEKTLMLAAAGNHGGKQPYTAFPAQSKRVICMKSANGDGKASGFNPTNSNPNFVGQNYMATGEAILTMVAAHSLKNGSRVLQHRFSGTSASTPVAAAYAALIMEFTRQEDDTTNGKLEYWKQCRKKLKEDVLEGMEKIFEKISSPNEEGSAVGGARYLNITRLF